MGTSITRTKILVPRRREDLLRRPRLLRILDDILDYPFTLISAPAGYGKTSLLIDLVQQAEYPVCWYSLDKLDQDPQRFLDHLIGCVQIRFPGFGETSARLVKDLPNPLDHSDQLITTLVNDLYEMISEHIVIILDDFHLVGESSQISSFISKLGQMVDDNIHLVMTSRYLFDFPDIPLLTGRRKIKGIGYDDLAFNEKEIKALFSEVYKQTLTLEQTKHLATETEGWITGLLLSGNHIKNYFSDQIKATQVTGSDIFNYLAEQVFQKQTNEIKEFLLQTSTFDEFSQQLCFEVLGMPEQTEWDGLIQHLVQQNLFIQQINDKELWIRYHHLFLDYLRDNLKKSEPDQEKILLTRLVSVYTQLPEWEKAFETAQRLDDANALAQVIDKASSELFHSGRIQLLSTWLGYLPEEVYESKPKMQALLGLIKTELGYPKDGLNHLVKATNNPKVSLTPLDLAQTLNWKASANRILSNHKQSLNNARSAYQLTVNSDRSTIQFSESIRGIGLANYRLGKLDESIKFLKSSLISYESLNNDKNIALVHMDLGSVYINQGILHEARIHYQNALDIWTSLGNIHQLSNLLNNLGYLAILTGDYIVANTFLEQALSYSTETANLRMQGLIIASFGDLAFNVEDFQKALEKYQESKVFSDKCNDVFLQIYLSLRITSTHRLLDNLHYAQKYLSVMRTNVLKNITKANFGLWNLEKGLLYTKAGSHVLGRKSFRRAFNIFKNINKPLELANVQTGQALLEINARKPAAALKYLRSASDTIQEVGTNQPLLPMLSRHYDDLSKILNNAFDPGLINLRTDLVEFRHRLPQLQR